MTNIADTSSVVTTANIRVQSESFYIAERSDPAKSLYFFSYRIAITNEGDAPVQLMSRHWYISDILGNQEEVQGDGVVGEQPRLTADETFEYTSFCPLPTYRGTMTGTYTMRLDDGEQFDIAVGPFQLFMKHVLN